MPLMANAQFLDVVAYLLLFIAQVEQEWGRGRRCEGWGGDKRGRTSNIFL